MSCPDDPPVRPRERKVADRRAADGRGGTKAAAGASGRAHARPAERKDSIVHAAASGAARAHRAAERAGRPARRRRAGHGGIPDRVHALCGIGGERGALHRPAPGPLPGPERLCHGQCVLPPTDRGRGRGRLHRHAAHRPAGTGRAIRAHRAHGRAGQRRIRRCGTAVPRRNDRHSDRNSGS